MVQRESGSKLLLPSAGDGPRGREVQQAAGRFGLRKTSTYKSGHRVFRVVDEVQGGVRSKRKQARGHVQEGCAARPDDRAALRE